MYVFRERSGWISSSDMEKFGFKILRYPEMMIFGNSESLTEMSDPIDMSKVKTKTVNGQTYFKVKDLMKQKIL